MKTEVKKTTGGEYVITGLHIDSPRSMEKPQEHVEEEAAPQPEVVKPVEEKAEEVPEKKKGKNKGKEKKSIFLFS